jgi:hypothetical protein
MIPRFAHHSVVLAPGDLRYNPCNDLIFPSVIRARDHLSEARAAYYMYYAPHDRPGGICLAFADSLQGPWREHDANPIIARDWAPHYDVSHVSSPHILWMEEYSRFFLYFHGENDTTRLASSVDGIHFDYEGIVVTTAMYDGITESSYARVFPCNVPSKSARYVMLFMGNNEGTRRIYAAWSHDGKNFEAQKAPLISPPPGTEVTQVGAPWLFAQNGRNLVIFHGDKTHPQLQDLTSDLYIADVGADFTCEEHLGLFYPREAVSPYNKRVSDPCLIEENGKYSLFVAIGGRLQQSIALACETAEIST